MTDLIHRQRLITTHTGLSDRLLIPPRLLVIPQLVKYTRHMPPLHALHHHHRLMCGLALVAGSGWGGVKSKREETTADLEMAIYTRVRLPATGLFQSRTKPEQEYLKLTELI